MILRRMEEDKYLGPETCIIMQRLIEEKQRDKVKSSGSLDNAIITTENICLRERDLHKVKLINRLVTSLLLFTAVLGYSGHPI